MMLMMVVLFHLADFISHSLIYRYMYGVNLCEMVVVIVNLDGWQTRCVYNYKQCNLVIRRC